MLRQLVVLDSRQVHELLPPAECIEAVEAGLRELALGHAKLPLREMMRLSGDNIFGVMPAHVGGAIDAHGLKAVSYFPDNREIETHQGVVVLFEPERGCPIAVLDACAVTEIRTSAASAVATRALAREDAKTLAILGTGVQAGGHLHAIRCVRPIERVCVWSRDSEQAARFADRHGDGIEISAVATVREAVEGAAVVCTVTGAHEPILHGEWLAPGTHVNAVGACQPMHRELDDRAMARARLFTDRMDSLKAEAGDYLIPLKRGVFGPDHALGELGDVLTGKLEGRRAADEITIFKSLGIGVEDVAAARHAYRRARELRLGTWVDFSSVD